MRIIWCLLILFCHSESLHAHSQWIGAMCPNQCTCQHQSFASSPQSRWIDVNVSPDHPFADPEANIKSIMCIIQNEFGFRDIVPSLPSDVQAITFLFTGASNQNVTEMNTGDLVAFSDLLALEVRGIPEKVRIILDAPLDHVLFVNFEAVDLMANERTIRRSRSSGINPEETFDYVPNSEAALYEYNSNNVELQAEEEVQVIPYEQYKREMKQSQKATFYGWSSLLILRLHNCHLDQLDAEVFDELNALLQLSLDHNRIKVIPAFAFYGIPNLQSLSLSRNEILDLHYRDLAGLLNLRHLDLSHNNLTKLSEMTFPPFPKLETLDLRHNGIQHIFAFTFDVMNETRVLRLGDPEVEIDFTQSVNAFDSLHELRELEILNASHPRFNEKIFSGLYNLHELTMHGRFRELTFDSFGSIPNITEITLSRCAIEALSMDTFYNSELLEVIDLARNRIAYLPPNLFDRQFKLRELYLQHNLLTTLPNSFFAHTGAKVIRLTDNPWICTCELLKTWKQGVTNSKIKRRRETFCEDAYNDPMYHGGQAEVCREKTIYQTVYDNKLSPRCDGGPRQVRHRAVYYVFRRDLKCKREEDEQLGGGVKLAKIMKGVGKITHLVTEDALAKSMHAKKMRIMHALAKKKELERKHFRHTNSIAAEKKKKSPQNVHQHSHLMNKWPKKVFNPVPGEEDDNELANQLEL